MITRNDATERQVQAARPMDSTWLSANAGSGKTRVLTDRVARLLLQGVAPEKVLCLTYTKAAASEMQNRLFQRLGDWAMMRDDQLRDQLAELGETTHLSPDDLRRARTLFASAIEAPGGLKIQTIHSFCASLLRRFPLEAGVSPQFAEMEDHAAALLRAEIVEDMAQGDHARLIADLVHYLRGGDIENITSAVVHARHAFENVDASGFDTALGLPSGMTRNDLVAQVFLGDEADILANLRTALGAGSKQDIKNAGVLAAIDQPSASDLPTLEKLFLFSTGEKAHTAKIGSFPTKKTQANHPDLMNRLEPLMMRVETARDQRLALAVRDRSVALCAFANVFLAEYVHRKQLRGALDFDDLIVKARDLLNDANVAQWVLYRLDGGIDHILVDEAQDTSPVQWEVIDKLAGEFTAGQGAQAETTRTIFVVGDKKQSIYSFQGADPEGFDRMQAAFGDRLRAVGPGLNSLSLEYSFRSSAAILNVVDMLFQNRTDGGFKTDGQHRAFHDNLAGRVDIWPVVERVKDDDDGHWTDPIDRPSQRHHSVVLAERVADQITHMLDHDTLPDGKGNRRPITAGDILILVQSRSGLFAEIIRACKSAKLPIAGADRLKVGAELAVRDLAALLRFVDTAEDDLSLAAALKSPLFGWSEQDLFDLAWRRKEKTFLWAALRDHPNHSATRDVLIDLRDNADFMRPYDLIERILTRHNGRQLLLGRLGEEAEDGINALLSQALAYERSEIPSLTGFLQWMAADDLEIKRQMGSGGTLIRVMTVHGSKGLESPIVIMPDTAKRKPPRDGTVIPVGGAPFWVVAAENRPAALADAHEHARNLQEQERDRLLYVAMTRAEKWLIVAAAGALDTKGDNSWYQKTQIALETAGAQPCDMPGGAGLRYQHGDWDAGDCIAPDVAPTKAPVPLPDYFLRNAPDVDAPAATVSPSDLGGAKALPSETGRDEQTAKSYGTALHKLLEVLPTLPQPDWPVVAPRLMAQTPNLTKDLHANVLSEAMAVLQAPNLAHIFAQSTLSEVPIIGHLASHKMHGVIDRLIIEPDRILAVDFKTNSAVPNDVTQTPDGLLRQMGAYAVALSALYPDRKIETAILWTAGPRLMILPHDLTRAAVARARVVDAIPNDT
jgi:ATP-dependent helicase/nuclease subunit A